MKDYEQQLKLQAYLDGELSSTEAGQVAEWVASDRDAAALLTELRNTTQALGGFETEVKLPETREFYWSKIQSAIEREERRSARESRAPALEVPWLSRLRKFLVPAAGLALVTIFAMVGFRHSGGSYGTTTVTSLEDAQAFTYHDYSSGATLVWLSYPADKHLAGEDEVAILE